MRNLLDFLARYNHFLVFAVLEAASLAILFRFNSYQGSVFLSSANAVAGTIYEWDSAVSNFFSMAKANEGLSARNLELELALGRMAGEAGGDSAVRGLRAQLADSFRLIPAKVISNSLHRRANLITLDKGRADGVRADMGVAGGNGVVGIVFMTSERYSVVIPILSSKSSISVAVKNRGSFGNMGWNGGATDMADVMDIPRYAALEVGDTVLTSGYSSIFPAGIMVGRVVGISDSSDGLSYSARVRLSTDFSCLRDVCVIDNSPLAERLELIRAAADSLRTGEAEE